jgi:hypothetical protein
VWRKSAKRNPDSGLGQIGVFSRALWSRRGLRSRECREKRLAPLEITQESFSFPRALLHKAKI